MKISFYYLAITHSIIQHILFFRFYGPDAAIPHSPTLNNHYKYLLGIPLVWILLYLHDCNRGAFPVQDACIQGDYFKAEHWRCIYRSIVMCSVISDDSTFGVGTTLIILQLLLNDRCILYLITFFDMNILI